MAITAGEYAQFARTDASTFCGMRLAWAQAMVNLDKSGAKITPELVKNTLKQTMLDDPYLKSAGTQKLLGRYIDSFDAKALKVAYDNASGKIDAETLDKAREGKANPFDLIKTGNAYSAASMKALGIESLTKDFLTKIKDPKINHDITITPAPLSSDHIKGIVAMDKLFRLCDTLDVLHKPVRQFLAHPPKNELGFEEASASLQRLNHGESRQHMADDIQAVEKVMGPVAGRVPVSAEDGKKFAEQVKDEMVRTRSEARGRGQDGHPKEKAHGEVSAHNYGELKPTHMPKVGDDKSKEVKVPVRP